LPTASGLIIEIVRSIAMKASPINLINKHG